MVLNIAHLVRTLTKTDVEIPAQLNALVRNVVVDSRQIGPGDVFVAIRGERVDGHRFLPDAFQRGAVAALVEQDVVFDAECWMLDTRAPILQHSASHFIPVIIRVENTLQALQEWASAWRRDLVAQTGLRVIGITGSIGKTSTKELVTSVLTRRYPTHKSEGNQNNEIGLPLTLLGLTEKHRRAVLEMGMYYVGDIALLAKLAQPHVGLITNVGPVHLERAGSIERIAEGKAELVVSLPPDGVAILNEDDAFVRAMREKTVARVFTYGLTPSANLWASDVSSEGHEGIRFTLHFQGEDLHVKAPLLGRHSVHTALRAAAVGIIEGLTWPEIIEGLRDVQAQLRLVVVAGVRGSTVIDDTYSASPEATLAALKLLEDLPARGRRLAVLGDMLELGEYTDVGHRKAGARAADVADYLVTVGSLGRIIADEAILAGMPAASVTSVDDNASAISCLKNIIREGDLVLVKGSNVLRMEEIVMALSAETNQDHSPWHTH